MSLLAVAVGWIGLLAAMMLLSDDAPAALVLFPDSALMRDLPPGVSILSRNAFSVTLSGEAGDFAQSLYRAGAKLVLPAGLLGCAPLTS
jgi:hypothetical protein